MCSVLTPASRAWLAISCPSGLRVRRDTQAEERPRRARPTAVLSSAPPTCTSRLRACSSRRKFGGLSRTIASPNVTTSCGMTAPARGHHETHEKYERRNQENQQDQIVLTQVIRFFTCWSFLLFFR